MSRRAAVGPARPAGVMAPCLRMATHNVNGLLTEDAHGVPRVVKLYQQWAADLKLHVVCLQETHITSLGEQQRVEELLQQAATAAPHLGSFKAYWGNTNSNDSHAGVAVLIRTSMMDAAVPWIKIANNRGGRPDITASPRSISMRLECGGHSIALHNVYLPSGQPTLQREFITNTMQPWLQSVPAGTTPLVCGDFNFTENPDLDRRSPAVDPARHSELGTAGVWQGVAATANLRDPFRVLHPRRRSFSFYRNGAPPTRSRLDRFYAGPALLPHVYACHPDSHPAISDHRPVVLHLRTAHQPARGRGLPKLRLAALNRGGGRTKLKRLIDQLIADAPLTSPADMITWWPRFKQQLRQRCSTLVREHAAQLVQPSAARAAAEAAWLAAEAALEATPPDQEQAAFQHAAATQAALAAAIREDALPEHQAARFRWLHKGERAGPLMSNLMKPPAAAGCITSLRTQRGGGLITHGPTLADYAAQYFANVSAPSARSEEEAQRAAECTHQVLQAVAAVAIRLPRTEAEAAGEAQVSTQEVSRAISSSFPGKSPGPDGIPPELWKWCRKQLAPVLAALFSAIHSTNSLPAGFNAGAVTAIYKGKGDTADLANYRPITLLNSDYRLLSKCLAQRWAPVLGQSVGPEQTAFLPGRLIGENIMFMQLLPKALQAQRNNPAAGSHAGAVAFLDFKKAYDTVSRDFLIQVMRTVGASEGMIRWAELLLRDTRAVAVVNGHVSSSKHWAMGVRQGCPLAPAMYLFVAWALSCWLQTQSPQHLGLVVAGKRVTNSQYADDIAVLLAGIDDASVGCLLDAMGVFAAASGQELNVSKSLLLPVGHVMPDAVPANGHVCGLKVVGRASTLGITFINEGMQPEEIEPEGTAWGPLLAKVERCFTKLARLPLSAFGRAFGAAGYGISKLLYHAEFATIPQPTLGRLTKITALLIDRGLGPSQPIGPGHRLPGIPSSCMAGPPAAGGVGLLPYHQHILARHAMWAKRLLEGLAAAPLSSPFPADTTAAPWLLAATTILHHLRPATHPALAFLAACNNAAPPANFPAALQRLAVGLTALDHPALCPPDQVPASDWCAHLPLWQHPQLQLELPLNQRLWTAMNSVRTQRAGMQLTADEQTQHAYHDEYGFAALQPVVSTLGELVALKRRLDTSPSPGPGVDRFTATLERVQPGCRFLSQFPVAARSILSTPTELCNAVGAMLQCIPVAWRQAAEQAVPAVQLQPPAPSPNPPLMATAVTYALRSIAWPEQWVGLLPPSRQKRRPHAPAMAAPNSGWLARAFTPAKSHIHLFTSPRPLTVKLATHLQLRDKREAVAASHEECVAAALTIQTGQQPDPDRVEGMAASLAGRLPRVWQLRWESNNKEPWWRLLLGGLPGAGGHGVALRSQPCPCGWTIPAPLIGTAAASAQRDHVMWHCRPAQAVRAFLQHNLPPDTALSPVHLWLLEPPAGVYEEVWWVVGLAAIKAITRARAYMWALHPQLQGQAPPAPGPRQVTLQEAWGRQGLMPMPAAPLQVLAPAAAAQRAVAEVAGSIQDFVQLGWMPGGWVRQVPGDHPFIGVGSNGMPARDLRHHLVLNARFPGGQA